MHENFRKSIPVAAALLIAVLAGVNSINAQTAETTNGAAGALVHQEMTNPLAPGGPPGYSQECSPEGGVCVFSGSTIVAYGVSPTFFYKALQGDAACNNSVFGDPDPGQQKYCFIPAGPRGYITGVCSTEGGTCSFEGTATVAYGFNGNYFLKSLHNGTACNNSVFGDPAPYQVKNCFIPDGPPTFCAMEGDSCSIDGKVVVVYGTDGGHFTRYFNDPINDPWAVGCNNSVFGDPAPGHMKACFYRHRN